MNEKAVKSKKSTKRSKSRAAKTDRPTFSSPIPQKSGYIEYQMPVKVAENLLKDRSGSEARMDPQTYLCNVVNSSYGLKGYCTRVLFY